MSLYVTLLLGVLLVDRSEAITCYACSYTYTGTDVSTECIHAPWNVTQGGRETVCGDKQFCSIHRLYDTGRNFMLSFTRMCELNTGLNEGCTKDAYG
ncbi:hypothetical protein NP493_1613g00053 [Ridgeia piscesae]|uniref:Sodefrin-like factor n=1 Tax=Ridgeia piscesae TaxID=27915 RepID=A0AAD9JY13_RIDPI|nr:hypothetical protein NP493_1613g00053 [Ridgeia piscesae]